MTSIYNIPLSCSFWDTLAQIYTDRYKNDDLALASVLFLVPNRRACQMLVAAFVRRQGMRPSILPQIVPISETDDDELFFNNFNSTRLVETMPAPISNEERLFLFTRMIMSKPAEFGLKQISLAQALSLAVDLANLLDTADNQGLDFKKLDELVPEKYATHWQETLKLLKIITEFWPQILAERNAIDVCSLKNMLMKNQAEVWQKTKPQKNIVAAGITANFPNIVQLLRVILELPKGEIYFAGLDYLADDEYWNAIDETHPQFELKKLLDLLQIDRRSVENICTAKSVERERFVSEIMRPAIVSDKWRDFNFTEELRKSIAGIQLLESPNQRDEALAIALKMRQILNIPEKTVALITYDRNLARRVASELERFDIKIDDSAGLPLQLSPIGIFLRVIAEAAEDMESQVKFITLLKNPFCLCGMPVGQFRKNVYDYELQLRKKKEISPVLMEFSMMVKNTLSSFAEMLRKPEINFETLCRHHIELAEILASSSDEKGKNFLWCGDAGKCAADFVTKILSAASSLGTISGRDYIPLLSELMGRESIRARYGTHPRLSILGPIEAKLCHFDYVILGEVNEGIWPKSVQSDMWMSRPMKKDFGFDLPEKSIGILGADLCTFLAADNVILTRAERVDGAPMKKSRWLLRLETVLSALNLSIENLKCDDFVSFAHKIDMPDVFQPIKSPEPRPPVCARPRQLSASGVDLLAGDPYSVFAKYILKLYPIDDLDMPLNQRDYGTLVHGIIEDFNNKYPEHLPENPLDILIDMGRKRFENSDIGEELKVFWWPKFVDIATAYIEQDDRENLKHIYNEIQGDICYELPSGSFKFTAKADRIDVLNNGTLNIIDYKTGKIPSNNQVKSGHALQLLLEGLIAGKGNFEGIDCKVLNILKYWHLGTQNTAKNILQIDPDKDGILLRCEDYLLKLINVFDFETTPYYSRPIPKFVVKNRDYEHLARIKEWSVSENEDGDD